MVTVGNYPDLPSAQVAKSVLDSHGIAALIPDEFLAGNAWQMGTAIQGVRLQVPEVSEQRAREILATAFGSAEAREEDDEAEPSLLCPRCGSSLVGPAKWRKRLKVFSLLIFPLLLVLWPLFVMLGNRHACAACGHEWD